MDNMKSNKILNLLFISNDWDEYHRKNFTKSIINNSEGIYEWLIVELPFSVSIHFINKFKLIKNFFRFKKNKFSKNAIIFKPFILFHYNLWNKLSFLKWIDILLLKIQLRKFIKEYKVIYLWIFHPKILILSEKIKHNKLIYDYYDLYEYDINGNFDRKLNDVNEILIKRSDLVIATSNLLYNRVVNLNNKVIYLNNGVNYHIFSKIEVEKNSRTIGYLGNIRDWLDFDLIENTVKVLGDYNFIFIGNVTKNCKKIFESIKTRYPNIKHINYLEQDKLEEYVKLFNVGIMPYKRNILIDAIFPNKLFEYFSLGIPVVSTRIKSLEDFGEVIFFADDKDEFANNIKMALHMKTDSLKLKNISKENSWDKQTKKLLNKMREIFND